MKKLKKLVLKKEVIANLENSEMKNIVGGIDFKTIGGAPCYGSPYPEVTGDSCICVSQYGGNCYPDPGGSIMTCTPPPGTKYCIETLTVPITQGSECDRTWACGK